jgi:type IV secretory pathway VirB3-like protein
MGLGTYLVVMCFVAPIVISFYVMAIALWLVCVLVWCMARLMHSSWYSEFPNLNKWYRDVQAKQRR